MENTVDLLQIKIDKAREELSEESRQAIDAIDWKSVIIGLRVEKGYSFTQIEDLEIETELLLCGLINSDDYPKELEKRMGLSKAQVDELVNEMNEKVFNKIREELVKIIERKKLSGNKEMSKENYPKTSSVEEQPIEISGTSTDNGKPIESREELLNKIENPAKTPSILTQKLSGTFKIPTTQTEHTLENITKETPSIPTKQNVGTPTIDPYREIPE